MPNVQRRRPCPSYQEVRHSYVKSDSLLLDRHGEVLHELRTDKDRRRLDWTRLTEISPALREAVIQAEDRRFFDHSGVDYRAAAGAVMKGLSSESLRGASTITMQLASFLDKEIRPRRPRKSFWQKGKQVLAAWEIEKSWSKTEILEAYLNLVTYRGELQGIMAASRGLFGKDPHGLDRTESLVLASLIRSPNASSAEVSRRASHLNHSIGWDIPIDEIHSKVSQDILGSAFLTASHSPGSPSCKTVIEGEAERVCHSLYIGPEDCNSLLWAVWRTISFS